MTELNVKTNKELTDMIEKIRKLIKKNSIDEALDLTVIAYERAIEMDDKHNIAEVLGHFSAIEYGKGHMQKALSFSIKSIEIAKEVANLTCAISGLNSLAGIYSLMGDGKSALDAYMEALDLINKYPDLSFKKGTFYNNIGLLFFQMGELQYAEKYYRDGIDFCVNGPKESADDELIIAVLYSNLAELFINKGDYVGGERYLKLSKDTSELLDDQLGIAICIHQEAVLINERDQDWPAANRLFAKARDMIYQYGADAEIAEYMIKYGKEANKAGEVTLAVTLLEKALKKCQENKYGQLEMDVCHVLDGIYQKNNDFEKAYLMVKRLLELKSIISQQWDSPQMKSFTSEVRQQEENRQMEEMKRTLKTLTVLTEVGKEITQALYTADIIDILAHSVSKLFKLSAFAIGYLSKDKQGLDLMVLDEGKRQDLYRHIDDEHSFMAWCVRNQKELIIYNTSDESSYGEVLTKELKARLAETEIRSALFCPLYHQEELVGGVTIQSNIKYNFTYVDLALFRLLVSYIAIAYNNINKSNKLLETNKKLEQAARIDGLTGLLNRRALGDYISKEFVNIKEEWLPMTMLMIDLDYFKQYNDFYGHSKGDQCLIAITNIIKEQAQLLETKNHAYRYGGDEFLIIIENCNKEEATELLEKIYQGVAGLEIEHKKSKVNKFVTLTVGGSVIHRCIEDYTLAFTQADEALYHAKNLGRNCYHLLSLD